MNACPPPPIISYREKYPVRLLRSDLFSRSILAFPLWETKLIYPCPLTFRFPPSPFSLGAGRNYIWGRWVGVDYFPLKGINSILFEILQFSSSKGKRLQSDDPAPLPFPGKSKSKAKWLFQGIMGDFILFRF